jgi:hypothetical protein
MWAKFGTEYRGQLMKAGLSDAAARTHTDALMWLYEIESPNLLIPKHLLKTITLADCELAAKELVTARFWRDRPDAWEVLHHADVYRSSRAAQAKHRAEERDRQRAKRKPGSAPAGEGA